MVAQHRIGGDVDGRDARDLLDALGDPVPAVIKVLAGDAILPAQEAAAHAADDAVVPGSVVKGNQGGEGGSWVKP